MADSDGLGEAAIAAASPPVPVLGLSPPLGWEGAAAGWSGGDWGLTVVRGGA